MNEGRTVRRKARAPRPRFVPPGSRARGAKDPARVGEVVSRLHRAYEDAETALHHDGPFQLLCATILSAQCTDARVNMVTPELFRRWPDARALSTAPIEELERVIHSTGFFRAKAKSLQGMARAVVERHGGEVPVDMEDLVALPGVGRKTANVLRGSAHDLPAVIVDTHCSRVSRRLGWTRQDDPVRIERDLMKLLPRDEWTFVSHALVLHGRSTCHARRPQCERCILGADLCPSFMLEA